MKCWRIAKIELKGWYRCAQCGKWRRKVGNRVVYSETCDLICTVCHPKPVSAEYVYALRLTESVVKQHYPEVYPIWEPSDTLLGLLTQLDNALTGWKEC